MDKTKTSKEQGRTYLKDMPIVKLKKGVKTTSHDPVKNLRDTKLIYEALLECLMEGDKSTFLQILDGHYEALNKAKILKRINLSRRTYYAATKEGANPSLDTLFKLFKGINKAG